MYVIFLFVVLSIKIPISKLDVTKIKLPHKYADKPQKLAEHTVSPREIFPPIPTENIRY